MKVFLSSLFLILFILHIPYPVFASTIKINEFSSASNPEWIELYNTDSNPINLNGFVIFFDDNLSTTQKINLGATDTISGNDFKVIEHSFSSSGWLNNTGDTIILEDQNGASLDSVTYGTGLWVPTSDQSGCRSINGGGIWVICSNPTKGSTNQIALSSTSTPTPLPTSSPTPTSTPTPSPTSQPPSFAISNVPSQINSDQLFSVSVNLFLPENPNTNFYLKGAFKKSDSTNYFGQTKVSGSWIKNGDPYSNQFPVTTNSSGNWSGALEIKPDSADSGFTGTGDYIFKVGKYNAADTSPSVTWSDNESTIKIIFVDTPSSPNVSSNSLTPTPIATPTPSPKSTPMPSSRKTEINYRIASVAAVSTESGTPASGSSQTDIKNQKQTNPFFWAGLVFILIGAGSVGYIYLKQNEKLHFPFRR